MQRHPSWNNTNEEVLYGASRRVKQWQPDNSLKLLVLQDRGEDYVDRYWVYFQGVRVHFGMDLNEANRIFNALEQKHFKKRVCNAS